MNKRKSIIPTDKEVMAASIDALWHTLRTANPRHIKAAVLDAAAQFKPLLWILANRIERQQKGGAWR